MKLLASLLLGCLVFALVFRTLTTSRTPLPGAARVAIGILVVFGTTLLMLWTVQSPWALLAAAAAAAVASTALQGDGLLRLTEALGRWRFMVYLLSVITSAGLVFLFVPVTTFLTSPGELSIHLDYLLSVNARNAMVVVYVAAALYAFAMVSRMRTVLTLFALGALVLCLIYSYVLPFGYPAMSGLTFEQVRLSQEWRALKLLIDAGVVVAVALALRALLSRFGVRPLVIGIVLINVSLSIVSLASVARDGIGGAGGSQVTARSSEQLLRFSRTERNVLVIFLDRFMGSYVESILQTDPGLAERLSGFTWYPSTVSAGENSIAGIHPLLGGYDYTPLEMNARGKVLRDLSVEAFSILPYNFSKHGYRVNVVSPRGLGFTMAGDCQFLDMKGVFCGHIPLTVTKRRAEQLGFSQQELSKANYADLLVLLAAMRVAPYDLKELLYRDGPWRRFLDHSAGTTFREWAELEAFDELSSVGAQEPNLNIVFNILPHEPYFMGEDCMPRQERFEVPDEEVRRRGHISLFSLQHAITARCALLSVASYLDFLKAEGVYANTKIIVVSDHGIKGEVEDTSTRAVAGGTQANLFVRTRSLLLVKEAHAAGSLQVSSAFMPNAEVPRIVCEEIGGCVNPYLDDRAIAAHGRDDPFYVSFVPWQFSLQRPTAFVIRQQMVLIGKDPFDARGWSDVE